MKNYIYDFKSIPIAREAMHVGTHSGQWNAKASSYEEANEKAEEHFKTNLQFRFEWRLSMVLDN